MKGKHPIWKYHLEDNSNGFGKWKAQCSEQLHDAMQESTNPHSGQRAHAHTHTHTQLRSKAIGVANYHLLRFMLWCYSVCDWDAAAAGADAYGTCCCLSCGAAAYVLVSHLLLHICCVVVGVSLY